MSSANSLLRVTVEHLRASAWDPQNVALWESTTSSLPAPAAVGHVSASPAFPFDVLSGAVVFSKATVLVIDLDSAVHDCVRVIRWCSSIVANAEAVSAETRPRGGLHFNDDAAAVYVPTLEQVLCCYLDLLRDIVTKQKLQIELVLGHCEDALRELANIQLSLPTTADTPPPTSAKAGGKEADDGCEENASPTPAPSDTSIYTMEKTATWLHLHQTIVLYWMSRGSSVAKHISLYTTAESGWTGAAARLNSLCGTPLAQNLQVSPVLWSTDSRAFFAPGNRDTVVSTWLLYASREVGQLCGRQLPAFLLFPMGELSLELSLARAVTRAFCCAPGELPEKVLVRHAGSTARRLGVRSAAYLPTLYALLFLHDFCRRTAVDDDGGAAHVPYPDGRAGDLNESHSGPDSVAAAAAAVALAAELVNHHCGILHSELVRQWVIKMDGWQGSGVPVGPAGGVASEEPLARLLWAANSAAARVTARDAALDRGVWPLCVDGAWRSQGPPPLWCPLSGCWAFTTPTTTGRAVPPQSTAVVSTVATGAPKGTRDLRRCLHAVRVQLIGAVCLAVAAGMPSRDSGGAVPDWEGGMAAAFGRAVHLGSLLALPLAETTDAAWAVRSGRAPAQSLMGWATVTDAAVGARDAGAPLASSCQTRASLDDVRERVRPAAQLTFVALSLLWCRRLWSEEDCLRFFIFFLAYLDAGTRSSPYAALLLPHTGAIGEAGCGGAAHVQSPEGDAAAIPCGVRECEVDAWWHALCCVTTLHSLGTSLSSAALSSGVRHTTADTLCDPGSVFTGCLPSASYGAADRVSFLAFLKSRGCLLPCSDEDEACATPPQVPSQTERFSTTPETQEPVLPVISTERLSQLRHALHCPSSLANDIVVVHGIWDRLSEALSQY